MAILGSFVLLQDIGTGKRKGLKEKAKAIMALAPKKAKALTAAASYANLLSSSINFI